MLLDAIMSMSGTARMGVLALLLVAASQYYRQQLASMDRAQFGGQEWIEDTRDGTGTRYRVITRGAHTGGSACEVELLVRPHAPGFYTGFAGSTPYHSHSQEETIAVQEGLLAYTLAGQQGTAAAGDVLTVPAGTPHSIWLSNTSSGPALLRVTLTPAGAMGESFFESLAGLGATYGDVTQVHPLQLALLLADGGVRLHGMPGVLSWAIEHVLPPFARALGFSASYPAYVSAGASHADE